MCTKHLSFVRLKFIADGEYLVRALTVSFSLFVVVAVSNYIMEIKLIEQNAETQQQHHIILTKQS